MKEVVKKEKITSLELLVEINKFRKEEGNKVELKHKTLLEIIRDEFEEEIHKQKILPMFYEAKIGNGAKRKQPMFILSLNEAKQVLMRESKYVRRAVIAYIEKLEQALKKNMTQEKLPFSSSVMIPIDKIDYWNKIKELSNEADDVRSEIYHKLNLLSNMIVSITREVDKLANIVFETEDNINKIEGKDMNLNSMLALNK